MGGNPTRYRSAGPERLVGNPAQSVSFSGRLGLRRQNRRTGLAGQTDGLAEETQLHRASGDLRDWKGAVDPYGYMAPAAVTAEAQGFSRARKRLRARRREFAPLASGKTARPTIALVESW